MQDEAGRIVVSGLTKVFGGGVRAVDDLSFTVEPGSVTGFLGPNGAGKTTTLRMLLGLVSPTSGTATISGRQYMALDAPTKEVGAALEASSFHPGRTARDHLRVYCTAGRIPLQRADEVLAQVGLTAAANRKVKGFSLGMRQRLGLASALIGDPNVLILDEPANGLDPEGIAWLRSFLRQYAAGGDGGRPRTVLVSSHVLSEVEQTVDRVVIINKGTLIRQGTLDELADGQGVTVLVRGPEMDKLALALEPLAAAAPAGTPVAVAREGDDGLVVSGLDTAAIGHAAFTAGVELHELAGRRSDLEDVFLSLTSSTEDQL